MSPNSLILHAEFVFDLPTYFPFNSLEAPGKTLILLKNPNQEPTGVIHCLLNFLGAVFRVFGLFSATA